MKSRKIFIIGVALTGVVFAACSRQAAKMHYNIDSVASEKGTEVFQPNWENMSRHYKFPEWFRDGKFRALVRVTECSDRSLYEPIGDNNYRVVRDHYIVEKQLRAGDVLRLETAPFELVRAVKQAVEAKRRPGSASVVLYHLEKNNLEKYTAHEIDSLYSLR